MDDVIIQLLFNYYSIIIDRGSTVLATKDQVELLEMEAILWGEEEGEVVLKPT